MARGLAPLFATWVLVAAACDPTTGIGDGRDLSGGGGGTDDMSVGGGEWDLSDIDFSLALDVQPAAQQMITVAPRATTPTVTFTATLGGQPVSVAWSVDRGDIGSVDVGPAASTTFTPRGLTGGVVTVIAGFNGMTVRREVNVQIRGSQNGADTSSPKQAAQVATSVGQLTQGGGVGGVGGEGLGPALNDATVVSALANPTAGAGNLALLYPYNGTVWPRGLPAPLLQWRWDTADADGIKIELSTDSGNFQWTGTFGRPAILSTTSGKFIRHPIPQDVWDAATNSAGGRLANGTSDKLTMKLTVAKGATASGPITQTWIIAPARLSGTIYYNSYGTQLAKNYTGAVGGDGKFGGAVLRIRVGDAGPQLAAGSSGTSANCRVCHSVAADGSRLVSPKEGGASFSYAITPSGLTETPMTNYAEFPGITPDGMKALTSGALLLQLPAGTALTSSGLTSVATSIGTPSFSPDGKLVAFNPMNTVAGAKQKIIVMSYDGTNNAFSGAQTVVDLSAQAAETRPGWPAFLPDGKSLVYHQQSAAGSDGNNLGDLRTRKGAKAQLAWAAVGGAAPQVVKLDKLNGVGYLPSVPGAAAMNCTGDGVQVGNLDPTHANDVDYNYEPTVNPVASGGYVWVVFTSRRMYGSVAAIPPYCSDPRGVDLVQNITPKKLWVAAIDVSGTPAADSSHPAFYLPGQELLAGNSRGFWVLDPCRADGASCESGDQCCNGYCQPNGAGGALVCSNTPPNAMCSMPQERCTNAGDCCDPSNLCVNGFCTANTIP
jgi:hypothetical protein